MNWELSDVQAGFRKGRETRDQIANIHWVIEKARESQDRLIFLGSKITADGDYNDKIKRHLLFGLP